MNRTTIDFGIDLGTTNSAIAVFTGNRGEPTKIIKNTTDGNDADITPSAVYINKKGALRVGRRAKDRIAEGEEQDVAIEFKRQMGTDHVYVFKSSGQRRKPEELSAEILKSLRGDVEQRTGEVVESAVITVPAAFELDQCDATQKAAELAGFKHGPLLQEPVAAALAYGFNVDSRKTYWLVYDFGGGTFDAAIIKSEEGTIHVVDHGGDNFLGGSNIDWAIVEKVLAPRVARDFRLIDFVRGNVKWKRAFLKLKRNAEIAKIDLSRNEKTTLETCKFDDDRGDEIEFECELTRNDVVTVAEPFILRAAKIAKEVLEKKKLGKGAIEKVILVGGPTLAPYFREILVTQLGIPLDHSVDPLTVVACGAAVFAGTQRLEVPRVVSAAKSEYRLELAKSFRPVGLDSAPMIGGRVLGARPQDLTGFSLELVNTKTQWRSGKIPLQADGVFTANLHAERDERNTFVIELCDASGRRQKINPDTLHYTIGVGGDVEQPLIHSMGIALANNEYDRLFEKGRGLPLKATCDYWTVHPIRQGQTGELIKIPIVEGEYDLADRNKHIDDLVIDALNIRRDLPAGSEVEVTLLMDESRIITASAYVPLLDEEFSKKIELRHHTPDLQFLREDFDNEIARFEKVKSTAESTDGQTAEELVQQVEDSPLMRQVEELLAAGEVDPGAAAECEKRLLQLKLELDKAANALEWPALKSEARDSLGWLQKVADQHGTEKQRQKTDELANEVEEIIRERKPDRLRKRIEQIWRLYYEIVSAQTEWWIYQFQQAEKEQPKMNDQDRAIRLFGQGKEYIAKNNFIGLQNVVRQLWDLAPPEVVQAAERGYGGGLNRKKN
jgi:molecular chaperone DnaK